MVRRSPDRTVLVACTLAFFATMVARLVISPVVPSIAEPFDASNAAVGHSRQYRRRAPRGSYPATVAVENAVVT